MVQPRDLILAAVTEAMDRRIREFRATHNANLRLNGNDEEPDATPQLHQLAEAALAALGALLQKR
jgi:hypothetical protein